MALLVVVLVYDLRHLIIPDRLVVLLIAVAGLWLGYQYYNGAAWNELLLDSGAAVAGAAVFAFLWLISKGRWIGLGDAKLAVPLGLLLGASAVFSLLVLAFWIGAVVSVGLILVQYLLKRGQPHLRFLSQPLTMKSEVPFAPFLILSFWCIYWFNLDVMELVAWWM